VSALTKGVGRVFREGLLGGVIAYLSVAVVLGLVNALLGRSVFHTAAALGTLIVGGAVADDSVSIEAGPILAYNGVHLLGSIVVASFVALEMFETERHHSLWFFFFMVLIAALMYSVALFGVFGVEVGGVLSWLEVVTGTVAWVGSLTAYTAWQHRALARSLRAELVSDA
jgi:hypothetical protein